jgi:hypothetical protein
MIDGTVRRPATRIRPGGGAAVAVMLLGLVLTACGSLAPAGSAPPLPDAPVATESGSASTTPAPEGAAQVPPATVELDGASPAQVALADVTEDGFLAVPEDISKLGWWIGSSPMGAPRGTTLIAGHVDSAVAGLGVFAKLKEMGAGDQITVVDGLGRAGDQVEAARRALRHRRGPAARADHLRGELRLAAAQLRGQSHRLGGTGLTFRVRPTRRPAGAARRR